MSELATNAALHGDPPITVRVVRNGALRIEVEDSGRQAPILLRQGVDAMTGRGLSMVSRVVSRWGVDPLPSGGKVVWAEFESGAAPARPGGGPPSPSDLSALLDAWSEDLPATPTYTIRLGPVSTKLLLAAKSHIDNVVRELMLMREGEASSGVALPSELSELVRTVTVDFAEVRNEIKRQAAAAAEVGRPLTDVELHLSAAAADSGARYLEALDRADGFADSAHFLTLASPPVHRLFRRWYVGVIVDQLRDLSAGRVPPEPVPFQDALADEVAALGDLGAAVTRLELTRGIATRLLAASSPAEMAAVVAAQAADLAGVESAEVTLSGPDGPISEKATPLVVGGRTVGTLALTYSTGAMSEADQEQFGRGLAEMLQAGLARSEREQQLALNEEIGRLMDRLPWAMVALDSSGRVTACNPATAELFGVEATQLVGRSFTSVVPARVRAAHRAALTHLLGSGGSEPAQAASFVVPVGRPDGTEVDVEVSLAAIDSVFGRATTLVAGLRAAPGDTGGGGPHPLLGRFLDASVTALAGQKAVLERMVAGDPLDSVLVALVAVVESVSDPGTRASIMLLDDDGRHLHTAAAPSLPAAYTAAIEGLEIGPNAGSCGTAAYGRVQVVVDDIETDRRWVDLRDLALAAGLRACWSTPIIDGAGDLLGTFSVYYAEARPPSEEERNLVGLLVQTAAIAVARARADRARAELLAQERAARAELEVAHRDLRFVLEATTRVNSSLDSDDTLRTLARIAVPALADVCLIDLFDGVAFRRAAIAAGDDLDREAAARLGRFSPDPAGGHPAAVAVRTRVPVFADGAPEEFGAMTASSCVGIPLVARGRTIGAMTLVKVRPGGYYASSDVAVIEDLSRRVALAVSNFQLYEDAREARTRLALVARAGVSLTSSLNLDTVAARLCELITGDIADRCEVHVRRAPGQWWSYSSRSEVDRLVRSSGLPPLVESAVLTGRTLTVGSGGTEVFSADLQDGGEATGSVIPLVAHGEVVGVIALASFGAPEPARVPADTVAVIAGRAALAIDNALLYEQERTAAEILQRSLLPDVLPETRGLRSAARYRPGGARNEVGGDWYDLLPLGQGKVAVVMGDVMGRGIPAASIMGQLRNGLRMLALQGVGPAEALGLLNRLLGADLDSPLATVAYGVIDLDGRTLTLANAGHLPPLLRRATSCRFLDEGGGLPLGAVAGARYGTSEYRLEPGDTLILYTDGLIEERGRNLDDGLARLLEVAAGLGSGRPDEVCDGLIESFRRVSDEDDTAVLVLVVDDEREA
ncbi:MAG: SpoIIE family protein phosphatase [Acidobacteriota bacterium]|nr:SpoIIE family protein phosphatase [Acidobacteriota bacterium]